MCSNCSLLTTNLNRTRLGLEEKKRINGKDCNFRISNKNKKYWSIIKYIE